MLSITSVGALVAALGAAFLSPEHGHGRGFGKKSGGEPASTLHEEEDRRLRAEYDALMDRCGAGVLILNHAGLVLRANLTARLLLGVSARPLEGKTLLEATLSDELNTLFRGVRDERWTRQAEIRAPGAPDCSLLVSLSPLEEDTPENDRFILVARNVTELRRLETIRRDFVANVSHELRTPLASIRAMAETLEQGALEDPHVAGRFLETIINEAQRLTRISDDLLVLSQAESQTVEKRAVELAKLIREVVSNLQPQAVKSGIDLQVDVPDDLTVNGSYDQLEQVVVNLVDNAVKYTATGGRVRVTAEHREADVAVHVADTGIGIMREHLPRLFERFYRVDKARSRQSGGTGLGLSIVKHIVESHGGTVTVESEYGRGSTFTFALPVS